MQKMFLKKSGLESRSERESREGPVLCALMWDSDFSLRKNPVKTRKIGEMQQIFNNFMVEVFSQNHYNNNVIRFYYVNFRTELFSYPGSESGCIGTAQNRENMTQYGLLPEQEGRSGERAGRF